MGLLDHYRQFEELREEEVNARAARGGRRAPRTALAARRAARPVARRRGPSCPPPAVVNAITFAARARAAPLPRRRGAELRAELAAPPRRRRAEQVVVGDGAAQLLATAARAARGRATSSSRRGPPTRLPADGAPRARRARRPRARLRRRRRRSRRSPTATRVVALCNPNDPTGELLGVGELRRLLGALPERVVVLLDEALRDFVDAEDRRRRAAARRRVPAAARRSAPSRRPGAWPGCAAATPSAAPAARRRCSSALEPDARASTSSPQAGVARGAATPRDARRAPRAERVAVERARLLGRAARACRRRRPEPGQRPLAGAPQGLDGAELAGAPGARRASSSRAGGPLGDASARPRRRSRRAGRRDRSLRALALERGARRGERVPARAAARAVVSLGRRTGAAARRSSARGSCARRRVFSPSRAVKCLTTLRTRVAEISMPWRSQTALRSS